MSKLTIPLLFFFCLAVMILLPVSVFSKQVLLLSSNTSEQYALIIDAGSTGSRVHVFRFDQYLNLLKIGYDLELFAQTSPGLSEYANDPWAGADSLLPLLKQAETAVPKDLRATTPVRVGATAGLRMLQDDAAERILDAVRGLLKSETSFLFRPDWVSVLDGYHEGAYLWVTVNYLLGTLGEEYSETVATVDLGGGSVQMAYAVSKEMAAKAPETSDEEDPYYVQDMNLGGIDYSIYAHSYLNYGLKAARAGSIALSNNSTNPCVTAGYDGWYDYDGVAYKVKADPSGPSFSTCRKLARRILNLTAPCNYHNCTFNGAWSGGGGSGQKHVYVASFFYDTALEAGIVDSNAIAATVRPVDYIKTAELACKTSVENIESAFPLIDSRDIPFMCMDLIYQYTLLVEGFGLHPLQNITTLKAIEYENVPVEVSWPLGCAIDVVSSLGDKLASHGII